MANTITGDDGDNHLIGDDFAGDDISGLGGDDLLEGRGGDDTLRGGDGGDWLIGGNGFDTLNGGTGDDLLNGNGGTQVLLSSDHPSDILNGGAGKDTMAIDYFKFIIDNNPNDPAKVVVNIQTGSGVVTVSGLQGEAFNSIEALQFRGPEGDDQVTGGQFADRIDGNGGNDILKGFGGDDVITDSTGYIDADGGGGNDFFTLDRSGDTDDLVIDARTGTLTAGGNDGGTFLHFENLSAFGGSGNDTITGFAAGLNTLIGGTGNDTLTGGKLADTLSGGRGRDNISGGGGDDRITLTQGIATGDNGNDTITAGGVHCNISGGAGDDTIFINLGGGGHKTSGSVFDGGSGTNDTLTVSFGHPLAVDLTGTTIGHFEALTDSGYLDSFAYILKMTTAQFSQFSSVIFGNGDFATIELADNGDVVLPALSEFRFLQLAGGGQTVDASGETVAFATILGGSGNDTVIGRDNGGFFFNASLNGGDDLFQGNASLDRIDGGNGDDVLNGNAGNDTLVGGAGSDTLSGGDGDDSLTGGLGADSLDTGSGIDKLVYTAVAESTGAKFDNVVHFDFSSGSKFDLPVTVSAIAHAATHGNLSKATFDHDLSHAIGAAKLGAGEAVLFTADGGSLAGKTFLVVDANGQAGYQAGEDYVFHLNHTSHIGALDTADFT